MSAIRPLPGPSGPEGPPGAPGAPGEDGAPGAAQIWRGEYDPATTYQPNDSVSYNGSSFLCTETTIGVAPVPDTLSNLIPPLATSVNRGSIAALPAENQTQYYARGDNTWQSLVLPAGAIVGTTDTQTLSNKTLVNPTTSYMGVSYRVSGVLVANAQTLSATPGGGEFIAVSFDMPAGFLAKDGDHIRIMTQWECNNIAVSKIFRVRVGGVLAFEFVTSAASATSALFTVLLGRFGTTTNSIRVSVFKGFPSGNVGNDFAAITVDLTVAQQVAVIASAAATGTSVIKNTIIEFLPVP